MAQEIHELIVSVTPQNIDTTTDELGDLSDEFEDSAQSAGESASLLEGFAEQFEGAAGVVLAGLSLAVAGLLANIPVIGEAMSGLFAILDSLILRLDERLRPVITPITDAFFNMANGITSAEGPLGNVIDIVLVAIPIFGLLAGLLAVFAAASFLAATGVGAVIVASLPLLGVLALLAIAIGALFVAYQENFLGIQEITASVIDFIGARINTFISNVLGIWDFFMALLTGRWGDAWGMIRDVAMDIANTVHGVVVDLVNGIIGLINRAIGAIESLINSAARAASRVPGVNISSVSLGRIDRLEGGPLFDTRSRTRGGGGTGGGGGGGQLDQLIAALQNNQQTFSVNLDGREVARSTEPFMGEKTGDQGRSNPL